MRQPDEAAAEGLLAGFFAGLIILDAVRPRAADPRLALAALALFLAAHATAAWAAWTLGPRWCRRVIDLPGEPPVTRGPYRLVSHPIYVATVVEWLALPALLGQPLFGVVAAAVLAIVLRRRAALEEEHLRP